MEPAPLLGVLHSGGPAVRGLVDHFEPHQSTPDHHQRGSAELAPNPDISLVHSNPPSDSSASVSLRGLFTEPHAFFCS
jgi:hypothetical protein